MTIEAVKQGEREAITRQVVNRLRRERNRRFLRDCLLVVLVTAGMIALAITNRDAQAYRYSGNAAQRIATALQAEFDRTGEAPRQLPAVADGAELARDSLLFNVFYVDQIRSNLRVGVCCSKHPLPMFLRAPGRHVVLFDGKRYYTEWMTEDEFERRAYPLGFSLQPLSAP